MIDRQQLQDTMPLVLKETHLPLYGRRSGKVRTSYMLPDGYRLLVTTDRLSAFDRILGYVPFKGQSVNQLAAWWFAQTSDVIPNHVVSLPDPNALVARDAAPFAVEVVVRGYITGVTGTALWRRYELGEREIYGYTFPEGLRKNQALPQAIITPTTKGADGMHDERLTCDEVVEKCYIDAPTWEKIQAAALELFQRGQDVAQQSGLILVDTKYEFGRAYDGEVILIDEMHTPDSSRYWKADTYEERFTAGAEPENFDKEFIRLAYAARGYRGDGEAPEMPDELWLEASQRYITIYEMLTGRDLEPGSYPVEPRLIENLIKAGYL